jgi:hypothetical protein
MVKACSGCSSGGNPLYAGKELSLEVTNLEEGSTYYWRVIACDEQGKFSAPGETWSFTVPGAV